MNIRLPSILAAMCCATLAAGPASAASPIATAIGQLEEKGYLITEVDADDHADRLDIEAVRADGRRVELLVETSSGRILREELDD